MTAIQRKARTKVQSYAEFLAWSQSAPVKRKGDVWEEVVMATFPGSSRPRPDRGIDLMHGTIAIQCKNMPGATLTFDQLATFFALVGNDDRVTEGIVCTTAARIGINARWAAQLGSKKYTFLVSKDWRMRLLPDFWAGFSLRTTQHRIRQNKARLNVALRALSL